MKTTKPNVLKALYINDTRKTYHMGCAILSEAMHDKMKAMGFEVTTVSRLAIKEWGNVPENMTDFIDPIKFQVFCQHNPILIKQIKETDTVVINGEGSIHGGLRQGPLQLLYLAFIAKTHFNKNVQIINHSVCVRDISTTQYCDQLADKDEVERAGAIYKMVYGLVDFVSVRERQSLKLLKHWNAKTQLAFDYQPNYIRDHYNYKAKKPLKTIVISGSVAWKEAGVWALAEYAKIMHQKGYKIKVLVGSETKDVVKDDLAFVECFKRELQSEIPWELVEAKNIDQWLDTIRDAALLVSGRFRHSIAAACLKTPMVALNSSAPKVHALMEMLSLPAPLNWDDKRLLEKLILASDQVLKTQAADYLDMLCDSSKGNFEGLTKLQDKYKKEMAAEQQSKQTKEEETTENHFKFKQSVILPLSFAFRERIRAYKYSYSYNTSNTANPSSPANPTNPTSPANITKTANHVNPTKNPLFGYYANCQRLQKPLQTAPSGQAFTSTFQRGIRFILGRGRVSK